MNYKKTLIIVTGITLLAIGCNKTSPNQSQSPTTTPANVPAQIPPANSKNVFTDTANKITLDYTGLSMQTETPTSYIPPQNNFSTGGKNLLVLYLNPATYKGTNLESGWFGLTVNTSLNSAHCYSDKVDSKLGLFNKLRTVQGNQWHYSSPNPSGGVAAGHSAQIETYRLYKNNTCYEVSLGLSDFNRSNLPNPDSIKAYDTAKMFGYLGTVFNKLKIQ